MKNNYELEYKLCTNDLLGKVQINSFERLHLASKTDKAEQNIPFYPSVFRLS